MTRRLKNGDYVLPVDLTKDQANMIFKLALVENKLQLSDLIYQARGRTDTPLKTCIIRAMVLQCIKDQLERGTNERN